MAKEAETLVIRFLLETSTCVVIIRKQSPEALQRLLSCEEGTIGISAITAAELDYGVAASDRPGKNRSALSEFTAKLSILPFDERAASCYGQVRNAVESLGLPIGPLDTLIAAHALALDVTLDTANEREFRRVAGLKVVNWSKKT